MIYKKNLIEIIVLLLVLVLIFISSDPVFYPDSTRYLHRGFEDSPLYHLIILVLQSIFKSLNAVVVFQTLSIGFGIIFFIRSIKKYFKTNNIINLIVVIFLFLPIIEFYNNLLTEPFSYALSLFFVSFIIRLIYNFNILNIIVITVTIILLLLIRKQFIFLYPLTLIIYSGILIIDNNKKKLILLILSFISIITIHNSVIIFGKIINKKNFKKEIIFDQNNSIFNFIFVDSIYISNKGNENLFKDPELRESVEQLIQDLDNQRANIRYYNGRGHFGQSFSIIIKISNSILENLANKKNTDILEIKKTISLKLIKVNLKTYIKFIFKKFYDSTWLFIFLPFFMMLASVINFIIKKSNLSFFIIVLSLFGLANHSLVYLFGRVQPRYLIYSDFILLIFIFIFMSMFLKNKNL